MRHAILLLALLAPAALAQSPPPAPTPVDAELQAARGKTCVAFLNEVANHVAAGGERGTTPSFALIWGALLKADSSSGGYMGKLPLGRIMLENTERSCQRIRGRTLGATMDAEYAAL
jgi:hypothetical protein